MSSILNALKKLEEDTVAGAGLKPRIRNNPGPGNTIRFFLADRLFTILVAGLIGLGVAGFWVYFNSSEQTSTSMALEHQTVPKEAQASAKEKVLQENQREVQPADPAPAKPIEVAEKTASPQPAQTPAPEIKVPETKVPEQSAKESPAPQPRTQEPAKTEKLPNALPEDSDLTLQAISWSEEPSKRIAVINNRICHEGEKIDGFVIRGINPEDVRVDDGASEWRLLFKRR